MTTLKTPIIAAGLAAAAVVATPDEAMPLALDGPMVRFVPGPSCWEISDISFSLPPVYDCNNDLFEGDSKRAKEAINATREAVAQCPDVAIEDLRGTDFPVRRAYVMPTSQDGVDCALAAAEHSKNTAERVMGCILAAQWSDGIEHDKLVFTANCVTEEEPAGQCGGDADAYSQ